MVSATNDFARQVIAGVENSASDAPLKKALLQYIMAFPVALKVGFSLLLFIFFYFFSVLLMYIFLIPSCTRLLRACKFVVYCIHMDL